MAKKAVKKYKITACTKASSKSVRKKVALKKNVVTKIDLENDLDYWSDTDVGPIKRCMDAYSKKNRKIGKRMLRGLKVREATKIDRVNYESEGT